MRRLILILMALLLMIGPEIYAIGNEVKVYFEASDPAGDDYGPGTYIYPQNKAFQPYQGLFDLTNFKVSGDGEDLFFDVTIATVTNPWVAPEGFIHPVIHIYIVTGRPGFAKPIGDGPSITMSPKYPWEIALLGIGWESSRLYTRDQEGKLQESLLSARLLDDGKTIRLTAPIGAMREPEKNWSYYLFTGSYDGFGPGFFREIGKEQDEWVFGGGTGEEGEPRILDLLAPPTGKFSQEKQLGFPSKDGGPVCLYPVGSSGGRGFNWWWVVAILALIGTVLLLRKPPSVFVFWYKDRHKTITD